MTRYMFAAKIVRDAQEPSRYGRIKNSKNTKDFLARNTGVHGLSQWPLVQNFTALLSSIVRACVPGEVGRPMDAWCSILEHLTHGLTKTNLCSKGKASVRCSKTCQNTSSLFKNINSTLMESNIRNRLPTFY